MTNLNTAIKRAIEGGYRDKANVTAYQLEINSQLILLDPQFWQCLGVAEGKEHSLRISCPVCGDGSDDGVEWWRYNWHSFIDALASGKTADEYFNNLLRK